MAIVYQREIQFYETDAMGVVHHSNYLRFFEESRTEWLRRTELMHTHMPYSDICFAVVESSCRYFAPSRFGERVEVKMEVQKAGATRVHFRYAITHLKNQKLLATGHTVHVAVDGDLKVCRLPEEILQQLERESWTETWP